MEDLEQSAASEGSQLHLSFNMMTANTLARTEKPFPRKFPTEIQDMIWVCTIDHVGPRVVHVKSLRNQNNQSQPHQTRSLGTCGNALCTPRGSIPLALQICHRSRELALRHWSPCLRIPSHEPFTKIFFNRETDFVYDGLPGLTSPLCILPHGRNITVELPHGFSHRRVHFSKGYQVAKQIHDSLYNIKTILLIVPDIERYISGTAGHAGVLEFPDDQPAGWIYSAICSWYRIKGIPLPEIQFTGLGQLGECFYKRCILRNEGTTIWDLNSNST